MSEIIGESASDIGAKLVDTGVITEKDILIFLEIALLRSIIKNALCYLERSNPEIAREFREKWGR